MPPKKDIEFPIGMTVRLDRDTHEALLRIAREDRRPPATVARMLIAAVCETMRDAPLHEILVKIGKMSGGKK